MVIQNRTYWHLCICIFIAAAMLWPVCLRAQTTAENVFHVWLVLYALVGAQMGWILRPFILDPDLPFVLFRGREQNVFIDVVTSIGKLFGA